MTLTPSSPEDMPTPKTEALAAAPVRKRHWTERMPVISQLRQSVGLQRGMLITGLVITVLFVVVAVAAPLLAPYSWAQQQTADGISFGTRQAPNDINLLGTTVSGFDVLSRVIWGAQTALLVIIAAIACSIFIGIALGLVSGYFGGWLDRVLVVIADAIYAFPSLLLAIVMSIVISRGQSTLLGGIMATAIAITVVFVPQYFRVVRSEVVRVRAEPFVDSAKVI